MSLMVFPGWRVHGSPVGFRVQSLPSRARGLDAGSLKLGSKSLEKKKVTGSGDPDLKVGNSTSSSFRIVQNIL